MHWPFLPRPNPIHSILFQSLARALHPQSVGLKNTSPSPQMKSHPPMKRTPLPLWMMGEGAQNSKWCGRSKNEQSSRFQPTVSWVDLGLFSASYRPVWKLEEDLCVVKGDQVGDWIAPVQRENYQSRLAEFPGIMWSIFPLFAFISYSIHLSWNLTLPLYWYHL